ncbi:N-acetylmuramoyl-L-alanine amidase [Deinococcus sp. KSM4-11]|uniref:N-acetylmuramoyl-L-alanine amidase family protein n=1 Tax=Deinococcus sp. KSM4-11 TaxID=2568654 RepID=UPI0010A58391|nr:N-acetylmuramoyl-L-alanine amidase [Deinococcus sp. KSM4-11]THF83625.1 N-acetylmuramoyl-L-alanine amidase [Deinococcus sp. KSM4-11]
MKGTAILLSSALLVLGVASAQTVTPVPPGAVPSTSTPLTLTGVQNATFGQPRFGSAGSITRVVFDLQAGVSYTLTPTFTGLRIDVQGARVLPSVAARAGSSVSEYRAGGGQVTLITPFPLSMSEGWRASEATLATGTRVLILEIGPTLSGGPSEALQGTLRAAATTTPEAQAVLDAPLPTPASAVTPSVAPAPAASTPALTTPSAPATTPVTVNLLDSAPPGDSVTPARAGTTLPPAPALPSPDADQPSALTGQVPGRPVPGSQLGAPRIGKNPGQTRVVLELPSGSTYRLVPGPQGLRLDLTGVDTAPQTAQNLSPELRSWRYESTLGGVTVTLVTAAPTTARSGWHAQLLPPGTGSDRSRLVIDLSPALADLTPLLPAERLIAAVPPVPGSSGLAILALVPSYVKPRVVLDPGHGGSDPGAVGSVVEKQVTLDVALRVRDLLSAAGVDVVLTRDSDRELNATKSTDLELRAGMGTPGTQLFVSIHVNAMEPRNALRGYGVETWWNPNHPRSSALAGLLQRDVVEATGAFNQGLKNSQSLSVLRNSRIPAALVEIGYTSHPVDGLNLKDTNYLDRVAVGIAQGIREALVTGVTASGR